jgi:hypothetical protein
MAFLQQQHIIANHEANDKQKLRYVGYMPDFQ